LAGLLALAACSGDGLEVSSELDAVTDVTVTDEVEQSALELASDVEEQMDMLTEEIQTSEAASELESAWSNIQTSVTAAIASMQSDGTVATDEIEEALDEFQTELDAAGDEIAPEVRSAWESLKTSLQDLMN
jgi:enamine deaminase RidA (YjgF/YER057c/UK114 family)